MVEVKREGDFIVFKGITPTYDYDIEIRRIEEDGVGVWIQHLRQKNWFDSRIKHDFRKLFFEIKNG